MFSINDYVVYGATGICKIVDIRQEQFGHGAEKEYYILRPVYSDNSTIYAPADNESTVKKMKPVLTENQIYSLIRIMPDVNMEWIKDDNLRKEKYLEIIKSGDRKELITLIKTLYLNKQERLEKGRKSYSSDDNMMSTAEKLLYNEFALVLNIKPEEVLPFIKKQLKA